MVALNYSTDAGGIQIRLVRSSTIGSVGLVNKQLTNWDSMLTFFSPKWHLDAERMDKKMIQEKLLKCKSNFFYQKKC